MKVIEYRIGPLYPKKSTYHPVLSEMVLGNPGRAFGGKAIAEGFSDQKGAKLSEAGEVKR